MTVDRNEYRWLWMMLRQRRDELERAADFYGRSPDGQYDDLANLALRAVLAQMERDD